MSAQKTLTVDELRKLPFVFSMHLNRGKEHDLVKANHEHEVYISTTSERPSFRVTRRVLYAKCLPGDENVVNLLEPDDVVAGQLERFCTAYNAERAKS